MQIAPIDSWPPPNSSSRSGPSAPVGFDALLDSVTDPSTPADVSAAGVAAKKPEPDVKSAKKASEGGQTRTRCGWTTHSAEDWKDAVKKETALPDQELPAVQVWLFSCANGGVPTLAIMQPDQMPAERADDVMVKEIGTSTDPVTSLPTMHADVPQLLLRSVARSANQTIFASSADPSGDSTNQGEFTPGQCTVQTPLLPFEKVTLTDALSQTKSSTENLAEGSRPAETLPVESQVIPSMQALDDALISDAEPAQMLSPAASLPRLRPGSTPNAKAKPESIPGSFGSCSAQIAQPDAIPFELDLAPEPPGPVSSDSQPLLRVPSEVGLEPVSLSSHDGPGTLREKHPIANSDRFAMRSSRELETVTPEPPVPRESRAIDRAHEPIMVSVSQVKKVVADDTGLEATPGPGSDRVQTLSPVTTEANGASQPPPRSGHAVALPPAHQALDCEPPNSSTAAQICPDLSATNNLQVHLGVRTSAFGMVDVHTTLLQNQVGISIHAEPGLSRWFSAEIPGLESHLNDQHLHLESFEINRNRPGMDTTSSFHHHQPHQHFSPANCSAIGSHSEAGLAPKPDPAGIINTADVVIVPNHLSIRI